MRRDLGPYTRGAYINHDSLIEDPLISYHGAKLRRLVVKATYDPDNVFQFRRAFPQRSQGNRRQPCTIGGHARLSLRYVKPCDEVLECWILPEEYLSRESHVES